MANIASMCLVIEGRATPPWSPRGQGSSRCRAARNGSHRFECVREQSGTLKQLHQRTEPHHTRQASGTHCSDSTTSCRRQTPPRSCAACTSSAFHLRSSWPVTPVPDALVPHSLRHRCWQWLAFPFLHLKMSRRSYHYCFHSHACYAAGSRLTCACHCWWRAYTTDQLWASSSVSPPFSTCAVTGRCGVHYGTQAL